MRTSFYIFSRINLKSGRPFSKLIVRIAIGGVAVGLAVLILTFAIVSGFQREIPAKITSFWGQVQISVLDLESDLESRPFAKDTSLIKKLSSLEDVDCMSAYAIKGAVAKTLDAFEGVLLKGVDSNYNWKHLSPYILSGKSPNLTVPSASSEILISRRLASILELDVDDPLDFYFVQDPPRLRRFRISGIYSFGIEEEFGQPIVIGDLRHLQKLNDWDSTQIGGYEIFARPGVDMDELADKANELLPIELSAQSAGELFPALFSWIDLFEVNKRVIMVIMLLVAGINMISALLILIMERTTMIGILKSLGMTDLGIQRIFLYTALFLTIIGMILGNLIGLGIYLSQIYFGWISLPEELYFVSKVPMHITAGQVFSLNTGTLLACLLITLIPAFFISRIHPLKAIRFD